jgi:hypothetical protein
MISVAGFVTHHNTITNKSIVGTFSSYTYLKESINR